MNDLLVGLNLLATGILIGLASCDYFVRKKIRDQLNAELGAAQRLTRAVEKSHNALMEQVTKLNDKVAAYDMGVFRK